MQTFNVQILPAERLALAPLKSTACFTVRWVQVQMGLIYILCTRHCTHIITSMSFVVGILLEKPFLISPRKLLKPSKVTCFLFPSLYDMAGTC